MASFGWDGQEAPYQKVLQGGGFAALQNPLFFFPPSPNSDQSQEEE